MRKASALILCLCIATITLADPEIEQITCKGKVVDSKARPVTGAEVVVFGVVWDYQRGQIHMNSLGKTKTDTAGGFSMNISIAGKDDVFVVARKTSLTLGWDRLTRKYIDGREVTIWLGNPSVLAGTVVDETGKPVAGARVQALLASDFLRRRSNPPVQTPEKWFTTKTDAKGGFRFSNIPTDAAADFLVTAPGKASMHTFQEWSSSPGKQFAAGRTDIRIVLPTEAKIEGRVVDAAGKPVAGIGLLARSEKRCGNFWCTSRAISGQDGKFLFSNLMGGTYHLHLLPSKRATDEWVCKAVKVVCRTGRTSRNVTVKVSKGGVIEVVISDAATKRPIRDVLVYIGQKGVSGILGGFTRQVRSGEKGNVRVRVPPGICHVRTYKKGYLYDTSELTVTVKEGESKRLEIALNHAGTVSGVVRDQTCKPIVGAMVEVIPAGSNVVRTGADGRFEVTFGQSRRPDHVFLLVRHPKRNLAATVEIEDESVPLDVKLKTASTLAGKVTDPDGNPIPVARVQLQGLVSNWIANIGPEVTTDAKGRYELTAVPPKQEGLDYRIDVRAFGYGPVTRKGVSLPKASSKRVQQDPIVLPMADMSVSGIFVDANGKGIAGENIFLSGSGQPRRHVVTDANGRFIISRICKGPIRLQGRLGGGSIEPGSLKAEAGDKNLMIILGQSSDSRRPKPKYLLGKPLPKLETFDLKAAAGKRLLICFWDFEQRPSRRAIRILAAKADELAKKGVIVMSVQASATDKKRLRDWAAKYKVAFPIGMVPANEKKSRKILLEWGVGGLPWLILTDDKHVVRAEGFQVTELGAKLKEIGVLNILPATQQIVNLVSEAQKRNRSLIPVSGEGLMKMTNKITVAGLKYEVARIKASGRKLPAYLRAPITKPLITSHASRVVFDGVKVRWNDKERTFAYDGRVGREYLPGKRLPRAYLVEPEKLLRGAFDYDPRRWCWGFASRSSFAEWVDKKRKKKKLLVTAREIKAGGASMYEVVLKNPNGFAETVRIDPGKGHEVVAYVTTDAAGNTRYTSELDLFQTPRGGWMPKKNNCTYRRIVDGSGKTVVTEVIERVFSKIKFGPIAADKFTFAGMGVPRGTRVFDKRTPGLSFIYGVARATDRPKPKSLLGKPLPKLETFNLKAAAGKRLLICFWDMEQRPSRRVIRILAAKTDELAKKGVVVLSVHASAVEAEKLKEWLEKNKVPFPTGCVPAGEKKTKKILLKWNVGGLPWLILTDDKHIVRAEGFQVTELDKKLMEPVEK